MANQEWISTGEAIRMLGFYLSPHTFRDKYQDLIPWVKTPGGHFRWLKSSVLEQAQHMEMVS